MLRFLALIGCLTLLTTAPAHARTEGIVWQDILDLAGDGDGTIAMAVDDGRLVAAGLARNAAGDFEFVVRAYDKQTGALLWEDRAVTKPAARRVVTGLVIEGQRVVMSGIGFEATFSTASSQAIVRAYVATTGALAWEDSWSGVADKLAMKDTRVIVGGSLVDTAGIQHSLVRVYAAETGSVVWEDRATHPPGFIREPGERVARHGKKAVVAGTFDLLGSRSTSNLGGPARNRP